VLTNNRTVLVRESFESLPFCGQQFFGMDAHSSTIFVGRTIILQKPIFMGGELKVMSDGKRWIESSPD
jgi:hypothetical protein